MERKVTRECMGQVRAIMDIFGGKWVFLIIGELMIGRRRFNELQQSLNVTPRQLSEVLKHLEKHAVLERKVIPGTPAIIEYSLTPRGEDFNIVFLAMDKWGEKWIENYR